LHGIPTVVDRVMEQAIAQVLGPVFDPACSDSSFGFRPERSAHGALRKVQGFIEEGYRIAVDLELAKFFDNRPARRPDGPCGPEVSDKRLLALIGRYLRAGVLVGETR
jgi:RNA-directed DNA polymerase